MPSHMPDVDPQTGLNYTPATTAGAQVYVFKMMAIGVVTLTQCLSYKWRKWQRQLQQQRQQEPQNAMAICAQLGDDNSPLGFDFDQLGVQDDHRLYSHLLADNNKIRQQLREQEQKNDQQAMDHVHEIQRLQVGRDTNDETHHDEAQRLRQQLRDQQRAFNEKDKTLEQVKAHGRMDKTGNGPLWER